MNTEINPSESASEQDNSVEKRIVREDIEWCDLWLPNTNDHELPRILLIGDSIVGGYYPTVAANLTDKAYVGRFGTSKSIGDAAYLRELKLVLGQDEFDIIHFNNGLHGVGYTEEEYSADFPDVIAVLREYAPKAKLIWRSTTPVRVAGDTATIDAFTERVKIRNAIAAGFVEAANIPTDDVFSVVENRVELFSNDGVHFTPEGSTVLGDHISKTLLDSLI